MTDLRVEEQVGRRIRTARRHYGYTQAVFAQFFGAALGRSLDASAVTRMEQGKRAITVTELVALAAVFDLEPEDFLGQSNFDINGVLLRRRIDRLRDELASAEAELGKHELGAT